MAEKKNYTVASDFEYPAGDHYTAGDKWTKPDDWQVDKATDDHIQMQDKKAYAQRQAKVIKSGGDVPASLKYERRRTAFVISAVVTKEERQSDGSIRTVEGVSVRRVVLPVK